MARATCPGCTGSFEKGYERMICCSSHCYTTWVVRLVDRQRNSATKQTIDERNNLYQRSAVGYRVVEVNPKEWWNGA